MVYEKLSSTHSLDSLVTTAVVIFDEAVDRLINKVFRKTDFAVKSVIDSLFEHSGPLFELPIRLKVLLGLGVITKEIFSDIEAFIKLAEQIKNNENNRASTDNIDTEAQIIALVQQLHYIKNSAVTIESKPVPSDNPDSLLYQMQLMRWEKLIRSYLILAITDIYEQLQIDSPL